MKKLMSDIKVLDQLRQGDVFIEIIDRLPEGLKEREDKKNNILVYGEESNHAHMVESRNGGVAILEPFGNEEDDVVAYLKIQEAAEAEIVHRNIATGLKTIDHNPFQLKSGCYARVIVQREFDYYADAIRPIRD